MTFIPIVFATGDCQTGKENQFLFYVRSDTPWLKVAKIVLNRTNEVIGVPIPEELLNVVVNDYLNNLESISKES